MRAKSETAWPEVLTVKELAVYLRCHSTTIYRLLRENKLPAFKVGNDWRFLRSTVDTFLQESQKVESSARLHVQVNGRAKRLNKRVGRGHDRIDEL